MTRAKRKIEDVIKTIDIVIELRDARIPWSSGNPDIRKLAAGKEHVIVLTKKDLADSRVTEKWLDYFSSLKTKAISIKGTDKQDTKKVIRTLEELTDQISALKQMIHQTKWGTLDFLLADLPPGTGDVHLSIIGELKIDAAVIVSTPQQVAVADVVRGVEMFRNENVNIPVAGVIENMAWFTPEELPENRYYIFGKGGGKKIADEFSVPFLGAIPIDVDMRKAGDEGRPFIIRRGDSPTWASVDKVMEALIKVVEG